MALPSSVAERLGRRGTENSPAFFGQLMFFAITIFVVSGVLYGGLEFGYKPFVNSKIQKVNDDLAAAEKSVSREEKIKVLTLHSSLTNLQNLLRDNKTTISYLTWLQDKTLTSIQYSRGEFNRETGLLTLAGKARTMEDFTKQLVVFQQDSQLKQVLFSQLRPSGATWDFDLRLQFLPPKNSNE